ncbi:MAG: sensor histidine kinase [Kibdelosporangium sp.]
MPRQEAPKRAVLKRWLTDHARAALDGFEHLVGGFGTAALALAATLGLIITALTCLLGVGFFLLPSALRVLRAVSDRERARLSRWGLEVVGAEPVPARLGAAVRDPAVRRELAWAAGYGPFGLLLGAIGFTLPFYAIQDFTFPLWWQLLPDGQKSPSLGFPTVHSFSAALIVSLLGLFWVLLILILPQHMARLQAWPGRRLLAPDSGTDLALRVAQLTATRAGALDAHATELRRIERALHDGTQNRLVAVNVLVGAARRALKRDPADAEAILDRVQSATEEALAELRAVVRSILPPVLTDRTLPDALTTLAANCPIACRIEADMPDRCAASVEATAYFVVAEALTNIAKHSQAQHAAVTLRRQDDELRLEIVDDGRGGADEHSGSGLGGIRRRIEAHDGTFTLTSPVGGPTTMTVGLPCGL